MTLLAAEAGVQKRVHQLKRKAWPNDPRAQAEHVHVVVLHSLMRAVGVVAHACAYAAKFVGRRRNADAAAADQKSTLGPAGLHGFGHQLGVIRIIVRQVASVRRQSPALRGRRLAVPE